MKKMRLLIGMCLIAFAGLATTACGPVGEDECVSNTECSGDELCYTEGSGANQCVVNCTPPDNEGACRDSETCYPIGSEQGCVANSNLPSADTGTMDTGMMDAGDTSGCMDNSECPGTQICESGMCVDQQPSYKFVQLHDITPGENPDATCSEHNGSDIFAIELQDSSGNHLGWAQQVADDLTTSNSNTNSTTIFDGDAPSLDGMGDSACPSGDFGKDTVVALGCNGSLVVSFTDDSGNTVDLASGQKVVVYEYGKQCCMDTSDSVCPNEHYNVKVCGAEASSEIAGMGTDSDGNFPTCDNTAILSGFGTSSGDISMLP